MIRCISENNCYASEMHTDLKENNIVFCDVYYQSFKDLYLKLLHDKRETEKFYKEALP